MNPNVFDYWISLPIAPAFSENISAALVLINDSHGSFGFENMTAGTHTIQIEGGRGIFYPTCTGGNVFLRGSPYEITDNSGVGCIITDQTESEKINQIVTDTAFTAGIDKGGWTLVNDQMIFYTEDNTTEIARFDMFDSSGNPTTTGDIYKRERV